MEWSHENNAILIENVKKAPVLWQPTHQMYGKRGPRDCAFKKIAKMFPGRGMVMFMYFISDNEGFCCRVVLQCQFVYILSIPHNHRT